MTIKELQNELSRIKKYYQMTGKDEEVIESVIDMLDAFGGTVYICDPDKNEKCRKTFCNKPEGYFLTSEIKYSKSTDPLMFVPMLNDTILT